MNIGKYITKITNEQLQCIILKFIITSYVTLNTKVCICFIKNRNVDKLNK